MNLSKYSGSASSVTNKLIRDFSCIVNSYSYLERISIVEFKKLSLFNYERLI